ncbi:MAG: TetR/AcrR family transcriptional regulator [Lachnospiraceae bacterium]|nr:TetR/AcrR family transcriptional regulator [Lachnospiraceae bacterium]
MPRDKTASHTRIIKAMTEEFLEKGYEGASIRSIGARAGITSAGLYRHYPDKEAMFCALVDPLIKEINDWASKHRDKKYDLTDKRAQKEELFSENFTDLILTVILPHKEVFTMLVTSAKGTKYENFVHDYVTANQGEFLEAIERLRKNGYPVKEIDEEKLHMLLSAYITACFEPIIHNYSDEKIEEYMKMIEEFFMPGWMNIMGLK